MKKMLLCLMVPLVACGVLPAATGSPAGADREIQIDPAATQVEFTLGDVLHTVHGTFLLKRGTMRFDPDTGKASGELAVDAASGSSGSSARDSRMRSNILEAGKFPEIVFRPDQVIGKVLDEGASKVQLHGMFSIHGAAHELVMPMDVHASNGQYTAETQFEVPYVKWGMKNPSTLLLRVSDHVQISIHTVAHPSKSTSVSELK